MLKKKVIPIVKTTINIKCGDCLHFKRAPKFEKVCSLMGVKHYSDAPSCYDPDVYQLATQDPQVLSQLGLLLKDMTAKDTRVFLALIKRAGTLDKTYGLKFGQPVKFCLGNSYLSNYFWGYVLGGADSGDSQVYVTSTLDKLQRKKPMIATLDRDSVFSNSEFKKHREKLIKEGRLQDPSPLFAPTPVNKVVDSTYVVPNMESADVSWFDKVNRPKGKKRSNMRHSVFDGELKFSVKTK